MLKIRVVTTDGAEPKTYMLEHARLSNREAKQVERFTGLRAIVFQAGIAAVREIDAEGQPLGAPVTHAAEYSDADHLHVLVWLALRRNGQPDLNIDDVPEFDTIETDFDVVDDPTDVPPPDAPVDPQVPAAPDVPPVNPDGVSTG